ncbi:hypothetical protein B0H17DRAFT_1127142 [Mycena rosella]|uniref:Uncharacterized protein n=1 Tax=Mycena rosella TaxID=1033263 RepID=A0AAD7E136_MYCRO|nr:hypothetical protein B0H17DRAFT_1127142 [Mycena rosella]
MALLRMPNLILGSKSIETVVRPSSSGGGENGRPIAERPDFMQQLSAGLGIRTIMRNLDRQIMSNILAAGKFAGGRRWPPAYIGGQWRIPEHCTIDRDVSGLPGNILLSKGYPPENAEAQAHREGGSPGPLISLFGQTVGMLRKRV